MPGLSKAKELREERARLNSRRIEICDKAKAEDRAFTVEEREELDRLHTEENAKLEEAEKVEREEREDLERIAEARRAALELTKSQGVRAGRQDTEDTEKATVDEDAEDRQRREVQVRAFDKFLRYGMGELDIDERRTMAQLRAQATAEMRAQGTNVDTGGGFFVPEGFFGSVIEAMKFFGGMRQSRATVLTTSTGNALPIPTDDDTSNSGVVLSENPSSAVGEQDVTIGAVVLNAYMYTSRMIRVSAEFLQDSAIDVQSWLTRKLAQRLGRATNTDFTTGTGSNKPSGVVTGATQGVAGATGQSTSVTADNLISLEHSVDIAYRAEAQWMANDSTIKALKQLKDGDGRYLWLPGISVGAPDSILGYPYIVNNDVAAMAASAKSILFGAFDNYYIRDVRGIAIRRLDERYADLNQVAFLGFSRHDGGLVDAGQNPIKYYQNSAS